MKSRKLASAVCGLIVLGTLVLFAGCSNENKEENQKETKGVLEQASDKVAAKAVEQIKKPLDKAREIQALQNAQSQKMEDMVEESGN